MEWTPTVETKVMALAWAFGLAKSEVQEALGITDEQLTLAYYELSREARYKLQEWERVQMEMEFTFGKRDRWQKWLRTEIPFLGGKPIDLIKEGSYEDVLAYFTGLEYGIYQ